MFSAAIDSLYKNTIFNKWMNDMMRRYVSCATVQIHYYSFFSFRLDVENYRTAVITGSCMLANYRLFIGS